MTTMTCEVYGCGQPATRQAEGEAFAENAIFEGSMTGVQLVGECCDDDEHLAQLQAQLQARAEAQLARDVPIHQEMHRLQGERAAVYKALRDAVAARDGYLAANSHTAYDPVTKMDRLKWSGDDKLQQAEFERLHQLVRDADAAVEENEAAWSATVALGQAPVAPQGG